MSGARLRLPRRLPAQATIGVCALSGRVEPESLERACERLRGRGHRVVVAPHATDAWRYFAAKDEERAAGFHALLDDDSIDLIAAARGGYGLSRVLSRLDWKRVGASGKAFVGFSDFTAFNMAACALGGLVTLHGPMLGIDFGGAEVDAFMERHFWEMLSRDPHRLEDVAAEHPYAPATVEGTLWGGNLTLITHLVGSRYFPKIDAGILYVEEISEEPYAIERLFMQLLHAGVLDRQRAILLGDFTDCVPVNPIRYPYSMPEVLESLRAMLPMPVLTGLPFGHLARKVTLPFGAPGRLEIRPGGYALEFSGYLAE